MIRTVEISCDLGEAARAEERAVEEALWPMVDAANVACGGHAGDAESMRRAVRHARALGVILGAHPSYPDREGFGRRKLAIAPERLRESLVEQLASLAAAAAEEGLEIERVKPHGALYNEAHGDADLAAIVVEAVLSFDSTLAVVAAPGSRLLHTADERGLETIREAFADRRYRGDGSLVPRSESGALLLDPEEAARQAVRLVLEGRVGGAEGSEVEVEFDTLCIHGDMEGAVGRLRAIREALESVGAGLRRGE